MPKNRKGAAQPISAVLKNVVEQLSETRKRDIFVLAAAWPAIAGKELARHSRPASLTKGTLRVFVDQSAWLYQANFLKEKLLQAANKKVGGSKIERIRFRIGNIEKYHE